MAEDNVDTPFVVQAWMFDALAPDMVGRATELLVMLEDRIISTARARHANGYLMYGSGAYNWTPEERLENVLEELADAVVYLTTGPLGAEVEDVD